MVISTKEILKRSKGKKPLVSDIDEAECTKNPAKIDLRLGRFCYCGSNNSEIIDFEKPWYKEKITIQPNDVLFFETYEKLCVPYDICAKMSLKMNMVAKGFIMPSQTQIDPGYENFLFGMIYNLSSKPIELKYKEYITTIEFLQINTSDRNNVYTGEIGEITFQKFVSSRISCSLEETVKDLKKSKIELKNSTKKWDSFLHNLTAIISAISIALTVFSIISVNTLIDMGKEIHELESTVEIQSKTLEEYSNFFENNPEIIQYNTEIEGTEN